MISNIRVDGFRSLHGFTMEVHPGLNVLIGPNGSGKTNIIEFFSFLSDVINSSLPEAVSKAGGAAGIFRKLPNGEFSNHIKLQTIGTLRLTGRRKSKRYLSYKMNINITLSSDRTQIYLSEQSIFANRCASIKEARAKQNTWSLSVRASSDPRQNKPKIETVVNRSDFPMASYFFGPFGRKGTKGLERYLSDIPLHHVSLLGELAPIIDVIGPAISDHVIGNILNIIPSKIKEPEDATRESGIDRDGSGLAATLFAIHQSGQQMRKSRFIRRRYRFFQRDPLNLDPKQFKKIEHYAALANPAIKSISVENDSFYNTLQVRIGILSDDGETTALPLSAMSDGTVKWLSIVTALMTRPSMFALEEPENFLHPFMQKKIVSMMRDNATSNTEPRPILISSHSETILNAAKPSEITIVAMVDGHTTAKKIRGVKAVEDAIRETGFGLGYFYMTDGLKNA